MNGTEEVFRREHLLHAWLDAERHREREARDDVAARVRDNAAALQRAFGAALDEHPAREEWRQRPRPAWWGELRVGERSVCASDRRLPRDLHRLFVRIAREYRADDRGGGVLAAPLVSIALHRRHRIEAAQAEAQRRRFAMLLEILELLWGLGDEATVSRAAAERAGWIEPDPVDPDDLY